MRPVFLLILVACVADISSGLIFGKGFKCSICLRCECDDEDHKICEGDNCDDCGDLQNQCDNDGEHVNTDHHQHVTTTEAPSPHSHRCNKIRIFDVVARGVFVMNHNAHSCADGSGHHDNDALVMLLCHAPVSSEWIEGELVLKDGVCASSAPQYTPVFYHYKDATQESKVAGILLSCDGQEVKVFHQECDKTPRILHIHPGLLSRIHVLNWI